MAVRLSAPRSSRPLTPGIFLVLISVRGWVDPRTIVRLEWLGQFKIPMTTGIEPAFFRLVAYFLNQLRYLVPLLLTETNIKPYEFILGTVRRTTVCMELISHFVYFETFFHDQWSMYLKSWFCVYMFICRIVWQWLKCVGLQPTQVCWWRRNGHNWRFR
jgi:hypothetical protein